MDEGRKAVSIIIKKLDACIEKGRQQRNFCNQHKFERQAQYFNDRISMLEEIKSELDMYVDHRRPIENINFIFV